MKRGSGLISCGLCKEHVRKSQTKALIIPRPPDLKLKPKFKNGHGAVCRVRVCEACFENHQPKEG